MKEDALRSLGLNERQILVYLANLELGSASVQEIASIAHLNRTSTYDLLTTLKQLGFVSYTSSYGKRHYRAISPRDLFDLIREKELLVKQALPELNALAESVVKKPNVEVYAGYNGVRRIFNDVLTNAKQFSFIGSKKKMFAVFKYSMASFVDECVKKNIKIRVLLEEIPYAKVPYKLIDHGPKMAMWIYKDRVAMISLAEHEPVGILIHDKNVYSTQKFMFDLLWDSLPTPPASPGTSRVLRSA